MMERIVEVTTIGEEFEKSRVKSHVRTRKGKLERVKEFERKGGKLPISSDHKAKVRKFVSGIKSQFSLDHRLYSDKPGVTKIWFSGSPGIKNLEARAKVIEAKAKKEFGRDAQVKFKDVDSDARIPASISVFLPVT